jgi:radical SAM superfamily enzyme YgiQ (UPF0313 family)
MPDGTHPLYPRFCRPPNLGLVSLAGSLREHAQVRVADLILKRENVAAAVQEALETVRPDLVGLSCMTFQYPTAVKIARLIRGWNPELPIALGGYHATMAEEEVLRLDAGLFDFLCRGESEHTLRELVVSLENGRRGIDRIEGLTWKNGAAHVRNPDRPLCELSLLPKPDRRSRLWTGYKIHGMGFDMAETSRGCTMPCNFCSITRMYGRSFRAYPMERIIEDLEESANLGAKEIFFADDNLTLVPEHLEELCRTLSQSGLKKKLFFSTQASVAGLARDLSAVERMAQAGFNLVFLGIENVTSRNLLAYRKGDISHKTREVLGELRKNRMMIMGGFILGSPDDREEDLLEQFRFMEEHALDSYLVQILTPYPRTEMTTQLESEGLVVHRDLRRYSGHFANVRTRHLSSRQLDYLRWKHFPYYRSVRWFLKAVGPRMFPISVIKETLARSWECIVENARKLFISEEHAFMKNMEKHLSENLFFGEKPDVRWPDDEKTL